MSRPEPTAHWIEPQALAFDCFRWHARAFCQNDGVFKVFLLSRILDVEGMRSVDSHGWTRRGLELRVVLEIEPYPELSDTQRRAIEMDYGLVDGRAAIVV